MKEGKPQGNALSAFSSRDTHSISTYSIGVRSANNSSAVIQCNVMTTWNRPISGKDEMFETDARAHGWLGTFKLQ